MPETVERRNGDNLVLLEKQREYLRPRQAHRLAPECIHSDLALLPQLSDEKPTPEALPNPRAVPTARETGICKLPDTFSGMVQDFSTELSAPFTSFSSSNSGLVSYKPVLPACIPYVHSIAIKQLNTSGPQLYSTRSN